MAQAKELPEVAALGIVLTALKDLDAKQQVWVMSSAVSNLGMPTSFNPAAANPGILANPAVPVIPFSPAANANIPGELGSKAHAKAFLRQKAPNSDVQRVACLAYYLATYRDKPLFKTADISEMNIYAAGPRIGNPARAVANATTQNKFFAAAGKGAKQLTSIGESVVEALPDQQAVTTVTTGSITKRKSKKRKAKKA